MPVPDQGTAPGNGEMNTEVTRTAESSGGCGLIETGARGPVSAGSGPTGGPGGRKGAGDRKADGPARRRPVRRRILRVLAAGTALLVLAGAGAAWAVYRKLDDNIETDANTAEVLGDYEDQRPLDTAGEAENILLIGTDDRSGANAKYGAESDTQRSDTTILLHLSADRSSATAVSIPRDLMTEIPACRRPDGSETSPQFAQFNWAFQFGGAACTIRTVENLTGIRIDHHLIVDFTGFKRMVDAVGGVEICLPEPVRDRDAKLDLPAGRQTVRGEDALAYVRARHSFGDGSDTGRIARQQRFLASLVKKVKDSGVLLNPVRLYPLLDAATSSLTADEGLDSLDELYDLARTLQDVPANGIGFLTVPRRPYAYNPNRDELVQPAADELFAALRNDRPVEVAERQEGNQAETDAVEGFKDTEADDGTAQERRSPAPSASSTVTASPHVGPTTYPGTTPNHDICDSP